MNMPEYIVVDEMKKVIQQVQINLGLPNLHYEHGYIEELNETLNQWNNDPTKSMIKFPLVWVREPFRILRTFKTVFGEIQQLQVFIIQETTETRKAHERMEEIFKPIILPIYRQLLVELDMSVVFKTEDPNFIPHDFVNRYYWTEDGKASELNDVIDCSVVTFLNLQINHNPNCIPVGKTF